MGGDAGSDPPGGAVVNAGAGVVSDASGTGANVRADSYAGTATIDRWRLDPPVGAKRASDLQSCLVRHQGLEPRTR